MNPVLLSGGRGEGLYYNGYEGVERVEWEVAQEGTGVFYSKLEEVRLLHPDPGLLPGQRLDTLTPHTKTSN